MSFLISFDSTIRVLESMCDRSYMPLTMSCNYDSIQLYEIIIAYTLYDQYMSTCHDWEKYWLVCNLGGGYGG